MKKLFTIFAAVLLTASVYLPQRASAQAPQKMSYQAVIRNASNNLVTNQTVGMQISILRGSSSGTAVYVETQTPTTNANGLVNIEIGGGTVVSGTFAGINWSDSTYYIKTETDPTGGNSYSIVGTSQLLSVPYALSSKGLTLPFSNSAAYSTAPFSIENTGSSYYSIKGLSNIGYGIYGKTNATNAAGVYGIGTGSDYSSGVVGQTGEGTTPTLPGNTGLLGQSNANIGVAGMAVSGTGGYFSSTSGNALKTIGIIQLTGIGEAANRVLTSDATGIATWQDNSTKISAFQPVGCKNLASVTTSYQKIYDMGTVSKTSAETFLEINLQTTLYVATFLSGTTAAIFELRVDDAATTFGNATCLVKYPATFTRASITGVFDNLAAGSHTISLWVKSSNGNATDAYWDPGCFNSAGTNSVLVKEL